MRVGIRRRSASVDLCQKRQTVPRRRLAACARYLSTSATLLAFRLIVGALVSMCAAVAATAEAPKRGGILTYMIAADGGPSLDGHRETTFAVLHATAPFYSVLIRVNPDDPSSATDFKCDLCTEMPKPTDNGLTYTFHPSSAGTGTLRRKRLLNCNNGRVVSSRTSSS